MGQGDTSAFGCLNRDQSERVATPKGVLSIFAWRFSLAGMKFNQEKFLAPAAPLRESIAINSSRFWSNQLQKICIYLLERDV